MSDEDDLFDHGRARNTDPGTSKAAATSIDTRDLIDKIYAVIASYGYRGCIDDDVQRALKGQISHSITPRYRTMIESGAIEVTGETRLAKSNRFQEVRRALPRPWTPKPKTTKQATRKELLTLLADMREIAEWHIGDGDECGIKARKAIANLDAIRIGRK